MWTSLSPRRRSERIKRIKFWEYAEIGYDTEKKAWFAQFFNDEGKSTAFHIARSIFMKNGDAIQYQWKDAEGRPFWHIRERFFPDDIEDINLDVELMTLLSRSRRNPSHQKRRSRKSSLTCCMHTTWRTRTNTARTGPRRDSWCCTTRRALLSAASTIVGSWSRVRAGEPSASSLRSDSAWRERQDHVDGDGALQLLRPGREELHRRREP